MNDLNGVAALVTGGGSGIGKATAARLKRDGARVFISDINLNLASEVAGELGVEAFEHDVREERDWQRVMASINDQAGPLGILVNNAGILGSLSKGSPDLAELEDWRAVFAINVEGVFLGCKAAIAAMRGGTGGAIVNISSTGAIMATPGATAYGASKAAVRQLTKSVAQHCAQKKLAIRCNAVLPGSVWTEMWEKMVRQSADMRGVPVREVIDAIEGTIPLGAMVRSDDIAAAVSFLVSDQARYVTGEQLIVDGGRYHCESFSPVARG